VAGPEYLALHKNGRAPTTKLFIAFHRAQPAQEFDAGLECESATLWHLRAAPPLSWATARTSPCLATSEGVSRKSYRWRAWRPRGAAHRVARLRARTRWPVTAPAAESLGESARPAPTYAQAARSAGFELAGVAAMLITVSTIVGLRGPVEGVDHGRSVTTATWTDHASLDTDTTRRAQRSDSSHRAARAKVGTLSQDSLAKRRDAAARARHGPRDSIKAHSPPPASAVVPQDR
jgi:hypothetical protein